MTHTRHFCDFCRNEISFNDLATIDIPIPPFTGRSTLDTLPGIASFAICPDCATDLKKRCEENWKILKESVSKEKGKNE